jgi:hypothetical protein
VTIDYGGALGKSYLAYLVKAGATPLRTFVNEWLMLKKQSGFQQKMYDYWIDGKAP